MDRLRYHICLDGSKCFNFDNTKQNCFQLRLLSMNCSNRDVGLCYERDGFYYSAEGTQGSSENNKENKENSVDKASEYRNH